MDFDLANLVKRKTVSQEEAGLGGCVNPELFDKYLNQAFYSSDLPTGINIHSFAR